MRYCYILSDIYLDVGVAKFILEKGDGLGSDIVGEIIKDFFFINVVNAKDKVQVEFYGEFWVSALDLLNEILDLIQEIPNGNASDVVGLDLSDQLQ